ncbi:MULTISPECIES: AI-2E family transporter [Metabacillus]|uniref:AI-2E family transporter n=1 Tax=Metabacillus hrfriensis TaxID=3048891 RepID=A0ACD4RIJ6_9BACI|nr:MULTISPECIES: AI-2E family transporter [Metabacillus]UAL54857.1 AI-2E family transporter [Metabacillus dongyingensis]UOK59979.1 AI-2E family transporter [Bacillus sp. OVS6]USK31122.1 AI-2E family transporter [Bacillus sp. CMF21]WHZ60343.1 AI-2E family transporter [Metabacillus sp. CT-WN-B3]
MNKSKVHFWTIEILLLLLIFYVSTKVSFLFQPLIVFASTLFFPILIAGILFFIFSPVVKLLEKNKVPRTLAILILYLIFIGLILLLLSTVGPVVSQQFTDLFKNFPRYITEIRQFIMNLSESRWFTWVMTQEYVSIEETIDKMEKSLGNLTTTLPESITSSVTKVLGFVTNITLIVITVPFILFYMLKDGHKFPVTAVKILPAAYRREGIKIFEDLYKTLAAYIQGQLLVSLFVGTGCFIGYTLIGLDYALILGIIVAVANIIPYLGPFIGAAPAVVIALLDSPTKALIAAVVVTVVQQIDGNILSPLIIGKRLNTHPLTIILLLIGAGSFGGILGMILAVPTYAVLKAVLLHVIRLVKLRNRYKQETDNRKNNRDENDRKPPV